MLNVHEQGLRRCDDLTWREWLQVGGRGPWPQVRTADSGPRTAESLARVLREHRVDLPTYVSRKCEKTRREGEHVRTGLEEFDAIWKGAPASVRRLWSKAEVEDMKDYTR